MTLSKTSIKNLNSMVENHGFIKDFIGQGRLMRKMEKDGLVEITIWNGRYHYSITGKGRQVIA